jgi:hypothetical protein
MAKIISMQRQDNCSIPTKKRKELIELFIRVKEKYLEAVKNDTI